MVRAGEAAAAHPALERLGPRVFPEMARQLIRASEAPLTSLPGALVRLLTFTKKTTTNTFVIQSSTQNPRRASLGRSDTQLGSERPSVPLQRAVCELTAD